MNNGIFGDIYSTNVEDIFGISYSSNVEDLFGTVVSPAPAGEGAEPIRPMAQPTLRLEHQVCLMQGNGGYFWKTENENPLTRAYRWLQMVTEQISFAVVQWVLPRSMAKPMQWCLRNDAQRYTGVIPGIEVQGRNSIKLPPLLMNDGPQGFRNPQDGRHDGTSTQFPSNLALAATWDEDLAFAYGEALGVEFRGKGSNMVLGPGVNMHRVPWNGRNFEYITGEDATLGSILVVPYVRGIQSTGVMACVKHLALNEQEVERNKYASSVPEAAQQEIYLKPFRAALLSGCGAVMTAYNRIADDAVHGLEEGGGETSAGTYP
jgi:hypothetical protein